MNWLVVSLMIHFIIFLDIWNSIKEGKTSGPLGLITLLLLMSCSRHMYLKVLEIHAYNMVGYIQRITVLLMGLQAALKMSHIELNLFTDTDMHLSIKERIFWDVSFIRHCFTEENDPKMEDYDGNKCNEYLIYLDANNLYGYAILQLTQMPNFKWMENVDKFSINALSVDSAKGCILEVDLGASIDFTITYHYWWLLFLLLILRNTSQHSTDIATFLFTFNLQIYNDDLSFFIYWFI